MKIALTGATGFLGRHVAAALSSAGHTVTLLVRPGRHVPEALSGYESRELDFAAMGTHTPAYALSGQPDTLVHLAWGGLHDFRALAHFETELPLHYRFLQAMVATGLPRLLVTGTCLEYGLQAGALEEAADTRPVCAYGLAKDTLRRQLELLRRVQPFEFTWARLFYIHGEGQPERALWPSLKRAAAAGQRTFPMSPGDQLRDYLPAQDVAAALAALSQLDTGPGIVNVCSGRPVAVRALVESWIEANGWSVALDLGAYPYADYEPFAFWGDRRKLDALLLHTPLSLTIPTPIPTRKASHE